VTFTMSRSCATFNYGLLASSAPEVNTPGGGGSGSENGSGAGNGQKNDSGQNGDDAESDDEQAAPVTSGSALPRTGTALAALLALGLVLLAGGSWLLLRQERTS
jgi:LPXTG-motif cell wall-anchored protein